MAIDPRVATLLEQLARAEEVAGIVIEALMMIAYATTPVDAAQIARDAISRISP